MRMQEYNNMQKGKVDAVFRIKSEQILMRALLWRKRRLPYCMEDLNQIQNETKNVKSICTHCQVDFQQEHINHCSLVKD
jgi:hypothetical protein